MNKLVEHISSDIEVGTINMITSLLHIKISFMISISANNTIERNIKLNWGKIRKDIKNIIHG